MYCNLGLAVSTVIMWLAVIGSRSYGDSNYSITKYLKICFAPFTIKRFLSIMTIILSGNCPPSDIGAARIGQSKGHLARFNCLVVGHTKYKDVQRVYCNPFPSKMFYGNHRMDPVMIWPPGIDNGAFGVSPETVWYARVLPLFRFSASAMTDTGSKSFDCALVSTLETHDDPENGYSFYYAYYCNYCNYLY
jgi:hypothetical protein